MFTECGKVMSKELKQTSTSSVPLTCSRKDISSLSRWADTRSVSYRLTYISHLCIVLEALLGLATARKMLRKGPGSICSSVFIRDLFIHVTHLIRIYSYVVKWLGSQCGLILKYYTRTCLEKLEKTRKPWVMNDIGRAPQLFCCWTSFKLAGHIFIYIYIYIYIYSFGVGLESPFC
jgi:hypothetical protein